MSQPDAKRETPTQSAATVFRIFLVQGQVIGAVASVGLFVTEGVTVRSVGYLGFACVCLLASVLLWTWDGRQSRAARIAGEATATSSRQQEASTEPAPSAPRTRLDRAG